MTDRKRRPFSQLENAESDANLSVEKNCVSKQRPGKMAVKM
jgi:hypothetical protein